MASPILMHVIAGKLVCPINTFRDSSRKREPLQLGHAWLVWYLASSSRTEFDSVSR